MVVIFLSKLLGFIFRMQFVRIAGEEAVGYYMASYPTFIFFISLVQFGLPIAISKFVAEFYVKNKKTIPSIMRTVYRFTFISSAIMLPILFICVPFIANTLLHNEQLKPLLYVAISAIPFVVFSSIFKAYLQGLMKIASTAFAQLLEQVCRIALIFLFLPLYATASPVKLATIVMIFTFLSEAVSFVVLYFAYLRNRMPEDTRRSYQLMPLLKTALPAQGSKLFGTFTWFLEPIVFLKALTSTGLTVAAATSIYGLISGVHIPLLLFPSFIPAALAIVLIPAISESMAKKNNVSVHKRTHVSMRICSLTGAFACTIFFLYGDALAMELFHISESHYMKILAPIFYFYYIQSPMHAILQASGEAKAAMMNSIYGGISKLFIMFVLASQPALQEKGAIIAIGFGVVMTSVLHIATLKKHEAFKLSIASFAGPYFIFIFVSTIFSFYPMHLTLLPQIFITLLVLTGSSFLFKQITLNEINMLLSRLRAL
jgi:stage V sporulation protein B